MEITRKAFDDARKDTGVGGTAVIDAIKEALANGKRVIVEEPDGSRSLLEPAGNGKYKTTPIAQS